MGRQGIGASLICFKIEQKTGYLDIQLVGFWMTTRTAWSLGIDRFPRISNT